MEILTHAQTVCTRLSFPPTKESLGLRLGVAMIPSTVPGKTVDIHVHVLEPALDTILNTDLS